MKKDNKARSSKTSTAKRTQTAVASAAQDQAGSVSEAHVQAPAEGAKSSVSFELVEPQAQTVFVAGTFNEWRPETAPLRRTSTGRWIGDLTITPGKHEYLFVVDGQWIPDPKATETVQNPFGGRNSVISVAA